MADAFEFTLNGRSIRVAGSSPNTTLLDFLRARRLTGSKEGCAEGDCGACTVALLDTDSEGRNCYRAINSCLVPVALMAGRELISVEGLACGAAALAREHSCPQQTRPTQQSRSEQKPSELHPVQQQMVHCHGSQCGYCTPGFIMSLFEGYYRGGLRTLEAIDDQLSGNLCRCTGYRSIREAAATAWALPTSSSKQSNNDRFALKLAEPQPALIKTEYKSNGETFLRPASLRELLELRSRHPEAVLIAGATELGLDITKRYKTFPLLISLEAIPELRQIDCAPSEWRIGGAVTLTQIEEKVAPEFPALGRMLAVFGSRQIRNRATMGGNIVTASPIGDSAPVLLALDAQVVLASFSPLGVSASRGGQPGNGNGSAVSERTLPISEFFLAYRKTALQANEVLKTILIPRNPNGRSAQSHCRWYKVSKRREMDISTVAGCFSIDIDARGRVSKVRLAYGGVAALPSRAKKTEALLVSKPWNAATIDQVLPTLQAEFTPISDVRGEAVYRRELIGSLFRKFFHETTSRAEAPIENPKFAPLTTKTALREEEASWRKPLPHESAHKHVTGAAMYTDDLAAGKQFLEVWPVCSPHAHAKILKRDASGAKSLPGIRGVLMAEDVPGINDIGTKNDEPLFPTSEVSYHGQVVALVVGESQELCRAAAARVIVEYEALGPILTLGQAIEENSFHNQPNFIRRGDLTEALAKAPRTLKGAFELGGQEHFYLETQAAWAEPGEDGSVFVTSSTQHPSEVQQVISHVLRQPINKVVVQSPRMGGGFGGKETQAALPAALAALAAAKIGTSVRVRFNRDQDMAITGHRHPFRADFEVGFDGSGKLLGARIHLLSNGGWALDLSQAVTDRALFHLDNSYYIPAVEFRGQVAKTHLSSNTAFRGFGGPQGMLVIEEILDRVARACSLPPEIVRERNLYHGQGETNTTPYGQELGDNRLQTIWHELKQSSAFAARRAELECWNKAHPYAKRGLAITPVKFGISFTVTHLNQAGALVLLYQDGTAQVNHGGTEMGQGVHTNITAIAARELGIPVAHVRVMPTSTDKVPNTSATAASCGTDLNGGAVQNACRTLRERLLPVATEMLTQTLAAREPSSKKASGGRTASPPPIAPGDIAFSEGSVYCKQNPSTRLTFAELTRQAYLQRVCLSATGYYATPGIHWDRVLGRGQPFHYFAYGAAVTEVEIDGFTGMNRVLRADILHDVGDSINPAINRGQIEGGFIQGMGWLTTEELKWDAKGRLLTHSPDTYKLPSIGDTPPVFNVALLQNSEQKGVVHGSKAVGEPPLMLALSVREAIRDAVAAFGAPGAQVELASPATCEAIFNAIQKLPKPAPASPARQRAGRTPTPRVAQ